MLQQIAKIKITNNKITSENSNATWGISINSCNDCEIINNTINLGKTKNNSYGFYIYHANNTYIKNNYVKNIEAETGIPACLYVTYSSVIIDSNILIGGLKK